MEKSQLIDSSLEYRIQLWLKPRRSSLDRWSALLLTSLEAPDLYRKTIRSSIKESGSRNESDYYDFDIKICRKLSISQIKILILLSWFLQEEVRKTIFFGIDNIKKKKRLIEHPEVELLLESKVNSILYFQSLRKTFQALFGELGQMYQYIQKEADTHTKTITRSEVFSQPFWKLKPDDSPNDYSGWSRHQRKTTGCDQQTKMRKSCISGTLEQNSIEERRAIEEENFLKTKQLIEGWLQ